MKKFSIIILILIMTSVLCFAGCANTPKASSDLGDCKVGYEFEVYPNVEFNYKINDDFIVHISDISATLVKKNEIKANETIEGDFHPYITKIEITGKTDPKHSGKNLYIQMESTSVAITCYAKIAEDGTFRGIDESTAFIKGDTIYFSRIIHR